MTDDRRRFSRIPFDATTLIQLEDRQLPVQLLDISLRGVLVMQPADWASAPRQDSYSISIQLAEGSQIQMQASLAHAEEGLLGFQCEHIDLDSISHLRRLIALNLGDETLLDRELAGLL